MTEWPTNDIAYHLNINVFEIVRQTTPQTNCHPLQQPVAAT
jgi:hypothetical protein